MKQHLDNAIKWIVLIKDMKLLISSVQQLILIIKNEYFLVTRSANDMRLRL